MRDYWRHAIISTRARSPAALVTNATKGGLLAAEDLARFHAASVAVKADYHGYEIYKAGFWTKGRHWLKP